MNNFRATVFFTYLLLLIGCNPSSVHLATQQPATSSFLTPKASNIYSTQEPTDTLPPSTIVLPTKSRIPAYIVDDILLNPTSIILKTEEANYKQLENYIEIVSGCAHTGNYGVKLHKKKNSYYAWRIINDGESPYSFDVTNYQALEFWVRGTTGGEEFSIDIATPHGGTIIFDSANYVEVTSSEWSLVHIPFSDFEKANPNEWMTFIYYMGFNIESNTGTICIDDIQFTP